MRRLIGSDPIVGLKPSEDVPLLNANKYRRSVIAMLCAAIKLKFSREQILMAFRFNETDGFQSNISEFGKFLQEVDEPLGMYLGVLLPDLDGASLDTTAVWDALFSEIAPSADADSQSPGDHSEVIPMQLTPDTTAAGNGPSGWFLKGVSVEGFRGINNSGKPLELKFDSNKVNSISAVNGVGKSSLYDAIQYAIRGKLKWLEELPASEGADAYYANRFHPSGEATIVLTFLAEGTGGECEITVTRTSNGERNVSASTGWVAEEVLRDLDREFVLLDAPTFQSFIEAKPLDRGRTFSGLLGLSRYSKVRQTLLALSNTRAFSNHFGKTSLEQDQEREKKNIYDLRVKIAQDFEVLVGAEFLRESTDAEAKQLCYEALAQIAAISSECVDKSFPEIDIDRCLELIKSAEGGAKKTRLAECISQRAELQSLESQAPDDVSASRIKTLTAERDSALSKTSGDKMLNLFRAGMGVFGLETWDRPDVCPLCDHVDPTSVKYRVELKLKEFEALDLATSAIALEWEKTGWSDFTPYEQYLEPIAENRICAQLESKGLDGELTSPDADLLLKWRETLQERSKKLAEELAKEQAKLEQELPASLVEVTKKIEAARRIQESWVSLEASEKLLDGANKSLDRFARLKAFLDQATKVFGEAESEFSKARLTAVEPVFKEYFKCMAFAGVIPGVSKVRDREDLHIKLEDFYGLQGLSPQALLSESFRNAFAISLYLAAASLYGGKPRFIILDDVTSSFDAGHQNFLVELIRTAFARPGSSGGPQVIMLSHDTMLEKLFNKHVNSGDWKHQRLEGNPQFMVLPQAGAVNKVKDQTVTQLQAGQVDSAKEGVRQYLEYRLSDLISRLRIPVPVDVAFTDSKQLSSEFLKAIEAAVRLHQAAGSLELNSAQVSGLNVNMATIVGNFLSHWATGQTLSFSGPALIGVMDAIDAYCECFTYEPTPGAPPVYYKTLSRRT